MATSTKDPIVEQDASYVDWSGCDVVERVPGKVSGRTVVRGTRILADTIVQDFELGSPITEIQENYPDLPFTVIQQLIAFAQAHGERRQSG